MKQDQKNTDSDVKIPNSKLRSKFCDGHEGGLKSPAQQATDDEIKYPRQSPVKPGDPFEPY